MPDVYLQGQPWAQQYDFNTTAQTSIIDWAVDAVEIPKALGVPLQSELACTVITKNLAFLIGVPDEEWYTADIYKSVIDASGVLGEWTLSSISLPQMAECYKVHAFVLGGSLYIVMELARDTVIYTSALDENGDLSALVALATITGGEEDTPVGVPIVTDGYVHLIGYTGSQKIYTAPITDGEVGYFSLSSTSLPGDRSWNTFFKTSSSLYALGGYGGDTASCTNKLYRCALGTNGSLATSWVEITAYPFPIPFSNGVSVITEDRVFVAGGWTDDPQSAKLAIVYSAPINSSGEIEGSWVQGESLPATVELANVAVTSSTIYIIGGAGETPYMYSAPFTGGLDDYSVTVEGVFGNVSPPLELVAGISTVHYAFGNVSPPLELVAGISTVHYAFGNVSPPLELVAATATNGNLGNLANVAPPLETVTATGSVHYNFANVYPGLDEVAGTASGSSVAFGRSEQRQNVSGFAYSHYSNNIGTISTPLETVAGAATTGIVCFGHDGERIHATTGTATGMYVCFGQGHVVDILPMVKGISGQHLVSRGRVIDSLHQVHGHASPHIGGRIVMTSLLEQVAGRSYGANTFEVLEFERDAALSAASAPPAFIPLQFTR